MDGRNDDQTLKLPGPWSRRQVLRGAMALGTGAVASSVLAACGSDDKDKDEGRATTGPSSPAAGAAPPAASTPFARQASITEWGFGVEETNPLAFARVEAFQ